MTCKHQSRHCPDTDREYPAYYCSKGYGLGDEECHFYEVECNENPRKDRLMTPEQIFDLLAWARVSNNNLLLRYVIAAIKRHQELSNQS